MGFSRNATQSKKLAAISSRQIAADGTRLSLGDLEDNMDIRRIPKLDEEGFERLKNISAPGISWQRDVLAAHSEKRATARIVAGVELAGFRALIQLRS